MGCKTELFQSIEYVDILLNTVIHFFNKNVDTL